VRKEVAASMKNKFEKIWLNKKRLVYVKNRKRRVL
jgi:hypothetical protein